MKKFKNLVQSSFSSLSTNKIRTVLTSLGIIIGIASVFSMLTLGEAFKRATNKDFADINDDKVEIFAEKGLNLENIEKLSDQNFFKNIEKVSYFFTTSLDISSENYNEKSSTVKIADLDYLNIDKVEVKPIDPFYQSYFQNEKKDRVVLINAFLESKLLEKNKQIPQYLNIAGNEFLIIGVFQINSGFSNPASELIIPRKVGTEIFSDKLNKVSPFLDTIIVKPREGANSRKLEVEIVSYLRNYRGLKAGQEADFYVFSAGSFSEIINTFNDSITLFLGFIGFLTLFVGGIGIMNTMLATISERTKEIGLRKALGANNKDITLQFMLETFAITLLAGLTGIVLGIVVTLVGFWLFKYDLFISLNATLASAIVLIVVSVFSGVYPALKASRLNPIQALKYE